MTESRVPKELYRKMFELTVALYRVTDFFPKGESLQKQMREKANQVLAGVTEYGFSPDNIGQEATAILAKIQSIQTYLQVVHSLRWVRPINLMVLEKEYRFLSDFFHQELEALAHPPARQNIVSDKDALQKSSPARSESMSVSHNTASILELAQKKVSPPLSHPEVSALTSRQEKILDQVKKDGRKKISDLHSFFPQISTKTIQRDLQDLVAKNILKKEGEKRWTVYMIK